MSKVWTCPKCGRIFYKANQMHSCRKVPLEFHFKNKEEIAKPLYEFLLKEIKKKVGQVKVITLPCCIHLFGRYDFIAILPKKDRIEIRFALDRKIKSKRIKTIVPLSKTNFKICLDIYKKDEVDKELLEWLNESYNFKKLCFK